MVAELLTSCRLSKLMACDDQVRRSGRVLTSVSEISAAVATEATPSISVVDSVFNVQSGVNQA